MSNTREPGLVDGTLVRAHGIAAFVMLLLSLGFGYHAAHGLSSPGPVVGSQWFTWGKMRYDHTQGILFGWMVNALFAFLYHGVPVLTGRRVTSTALGRWLFVLWNFAVVIPGWILVLAGFSQPLEWAEFPLITDAFIVFCFLLAAWQFLPGFFRKDLADLYVSSWYVIGGLVFTLLSYPMGNIVPELVPGAQGALFSGLWIHDAVGLFVTPMALAILYYVIPAVTGRPIYSHFLSMLGFWLLFFIYPLNGTHHYIYSVIPMSAQMAGVVASTILGVDVIIVVANLLLSLRGAGLFPRDPALRFVSTSTVLYLIVSLQGALQSQMPVNRLLHFSDWVVGHAHLAMAGFASFAFLGGLVHAWQHLPGARFNARLISWGYWLLLIGLLAMFVDLTAAGIVEARLWADGAPWIASVRAAQPYWYFRTWMTVPFFAAFFAILGGLLTGTRSAEAAPAAAPVVGPDLVGVGARRSLNMAYSVAAVGGLGFFIMSIVLLGIVPARALARQVAAQSPVKVAALTATEQRGRQVYAREGCAYCHTQQIRYTAADVERFGAATLAWENNLDYPQLWGTRRIGGDLSRESGVRTGQWQMAHLYSARIMTPGSVMPDFRHLFRTSPDEPKQEALDLVAYLETLGHAREMAAPEGEKKAKANCNCDQETSLMAFIGDEPGELNRHPAKVRTGSAPQLTVSTASAGALYANCVVCHGSVGTGRGAAASGLFTPAPANFAEHEYTLKRLAQVLWNGKRGTSMPAWRQFTNEELSALAGVVRSYSRTKPEGAPTAAKLELGRTVYDKHCSSCHGVTGAGDGPDSKKSSMDATNFHEQRASSNRAAASTRDGIAGTPMEAYSTKLSADEIGAVASYVREFYVGDR